MAFLTFCCISIVLVLCLLFCIVKEWQLVMCLLAVHLNQIIGTCQHLSVSDQLSGWHVDWGKVTCIEIQIEHLPCHLRETWIGSCGDLFLGSHHLLLFLCSSLSNLNIGYICVFSEVILVLLRKHFVDCHKSCSSMQSVLLKTFTQMCINYLDHK